jgi:Tol biopolymer transport system component
MPIDFGAHHCFSSSGLVHASYTRRAGPSKVRVTTNSRSDFRSPRTVREGHTRDSAIYAVDPSGKGLIELAAGVSYRSAPAWSPDGQRIAFVRPDGLYVMTADGKDSSRLVACARRDCQGLGTPAWSPDGGRIAFPGSWNGRDGLWVVETDGGGLVPIRQGLTVLGAPAWSPDGQDIAVSGHLAADPGTHSILVLSATTGQIVRAISVAGIEFSETVSWSSNGMWLAASGSGSSGISEGEGIYLIRADGSQSRLLTSCPASPSCIDVYPTWSPDGRHIAFTRGRCSERGGDCFTGDVYVIDVETGRSHPLTSGPGLDCCPSWQPHSAVPQVAPFQAETLPPVGVVSDGKRHCPALSTELDSERHRSDLCLG